MQYSTDIIQKILDQNRQIKKVSLINFTKVKSLQERFNLSTRQKKAIDKALQIRKIYRLPFWDSLLLTQFDSGLFSKDIIKEASLHNRTQKRGFLNKNEWNKITKKIFTNDINLGFNSLVITNDAKRMHIPLLDFHIPNSKQNIPCVAEVIHHLQLEGFLLKTNKSFHFYGSQLLNEKDFINFLSKSLLFSPIIDKNWLSHQLIEKSATLRISPKEGEIPYLIKVIKK